MQYYRITLSDSIILQRFFHLKVFLVLVLRLFYEEKKISKEPLRIALVACRYVLSFVGVK